MSGLDSRAVKNEKVKVMQKADRADGGLGSEGKRIIKSYRIINSYRIVTQPPAAGYG